MKLVYLALLVLPAVLLCLQNESKFFAHAEDEIDDELVDIEGEDNQVVGDDLVSDNDEENSKPSDVDTTILFIKPAPITPGVQYELRAGYPVEFLVGFLNKGSEEYIIETLDASFRYPMDYTYHIQNFSAIAYNKEVKPGQEATLSYSFLPSEAFAGRPFGLNINLNYRDVSRNSFQEAVYNQTVNIVEVSSGLDGETFFLYVFLGAVVVLGLVLGQQALGSLARRNRSGAAHTKPHKHIETGTGTNNSNVDYDWLPKQVLNQIIPGQAFGGNFKKFGPQNHLLSKDKSRSSSSRVPSSATFSEVGNHRQQSEPTISSNSPKRCEMNGLKFLLSDPLNEYGTPSAHGEKVGAPQLARCSVRQKTDTSAIWGAAI